MRTAILAVVLLCAISSAYAVSYSVSSVADLKASM